MSCLATLLNGCENIQDELNQYFPTCGATTFKEPIPELEWLLSPSNRGDLKNLIAPGSGKVRTVNLRYRKRLLESFVDDDAAKTCVADTKLGDCIKPYEIDTTKNSQASVLIAEGDLNESCRNNGDFFMETLAMLMDVVERKVATKSAVQMAALTGAYATDVAVTADELVVKTLKDSSADPYPSTLQEIDLAMLKTGFCAPVIIFADDLLHKYYRNLLTGCCSTNGINLAEQLSQYQKAVVYSRRISAALGSTKSMIAMQGALQLIWWNQNDWKNDLAPIFKQGQNYFSTILVSPRTGLEMDVRISDNCGDVSIIVTATTKVVGMPDDMFPVGDVYEGVSFVNKIKVTNI